MVESAYTVLCIYIVVIFDEAKAEIAVNVMSRWRSRGWVLPLAMTRRGIDDRLAAYHLPELAAIALQHVI